jgi:hypothetical protein
MSNGVGATRPEKKNPQTTTRTRSRTQEPMKAPKSGYTMVPNWMLEGWMRRAPLVVGIEAKVLRETVGWQRQWYETTVTALSKDVDKSRQKTSKVLGKLVREGVVLRRRVKGPQEKIMLALAGVCEEPKEGAVENSKGVEPQGDTPLEPQGDTPLEPQGDTPLEIEAVEVEAESLPKDKNRQKEIYKETSVLTGGGELPSENSSGEEDQQLNKAKAKQVAAFIASATSQFKTPPSRSKTNRNRSRTTNAHLGSDSLWRIQGFPARRLVLADYRMDEKTFFAEWKEVHGDDPDHFRLQCYILNNFIAAEARELIHNLAGAKFNIYGYANRVIRDSYSPQC